MLKKILFMALLGTVSAFAGAISEINESTFDSKIKSGTVLVDFYADWCGPCKRLGPVLEMVDDDIGNKVSIYKVNVDQSKSLAKRYEVQGMPTMILFENGEVKARLVGFHPKAKVIEFIETKGS